MFGERRWIDVNHEWNILSAQLLHWERSHFFSPLKTVPFLSAEFWWASVIFVTFKDKKLIRRWDSEREHFYDDIVHAEARACAIEPTSSFLLSNYANASNYTHQTELYQSTIVTMDSPIQAVILWYQKLIRRHGHGQLQSEMEAIASACFAQILAE